MTWAFLSWQGQRRYALHFYDYVFTFQIAVYLRTLDAPEFRKAKEYGRKAVLLDTNGTKVKHIWSDAFSTYLSASLASLRLPTGLNLNVFPPHAHSSNPVENCIRKSTRSCQKKHCEPRRHRCSGQSSDKGRRARVVVARIRIRHSARKYFTECSPPSTCW